MCAGRSSLLGVPWCPTTNQRPRTHVRRSATRQTESTGVSSHGWLRMSCCGCPFCDNPTSLCDHTRNLAGGAHDRRRETVSNRIWLGDSAKAQPRIEGDLPGTHWLCLSDDQPIAGEEIRPATHSTLLCISCDTVARGRSVETRGSKKLRRRGSWKRGERSR